MPVFEGGEISLEDYEEFLMHYGVKGMKWGVKRTPEQLGHKKANAASTLKRAGQFLKDTYGSASAAAKAKREEKARKKREKKGPSAMTNEELATGISRLEQEKKYRLLKDEQKQANEGAVLKLLKSAGSKLVNKATDAVINAVLDGAFKKSTNTGQIDLATTDLSKLDDNTIAALVKRQANESKIKQRRESDILRADSEVQNWLESHASYPVGRTTSNRSTISDSEQHRRRHSGGTTRNASAQGTSSGFARYAQQYGEDKARTVQQRLNQYRRERLRDTNDDD